MHFISMASNMSMTDLKSVPLCGCEFESRRADQPLLQPNILIPTVNINPDFFEEIHSFTLPNLTNLVFSGLNIGFETR